MGILMGLGIIITGGTLCLTILGVPILAAFIVATTIVVILVLMGH